MLKKALAGALLICVLMFTGLFFWARATFTQDSARAALAAQLSRALGQPVTIGSIGVAIYPRVTVNLDNVAIGAPPRITAARFHIGTNLGALLWRRIEHADLRLTAVRVELPLPEFAFASARETASSRVPVELVSIDEIVLDDVQLVSGGRTLGGDIELVPHGKGFTIRKARLQAGDASLDIAGEITDLSGPSGELAVSGGKLDLDALLAFVSEFAGSAGGAAARGAQRSGAPISPMNISMSLAAESGTIGTLILDRPLGRAHITREAMTLDPIGFGVFGGKYEGTLGFSLAKTAGFRAHAALSGLDMNAVMAFAGRPGIMTGRLSGAVDLAGTGMDAASVLKSAHGTARLNIANGTVKNLGLVRTIVVATSGRSGAAPQSSDMSRDEPFSRLGATLAIAGGGANTRDLMFESDDLLLSASGSFRLDGSAIALAGQVQLSEALSQRAGRDLVRYTQEEGRPTLPLRITGSAGNPEVSIDLQRLLGRAITNRANEEVQKALRKGLGGLFPR